MILTFMFINNVYINVYQLLTTQGPTFCVEGKYLQGDGSCHENGQINFTDQFYQEK